jgi:hypothetical protein|tara:strand:+ start:1436 stop:1543 length:108 start_codon:yes stop_codon:yes gene_type:complete
LNAHRHAAAFVDLPDFSFWQMMRERALPNVGFGAA